MNAPVDMHAFLDCEYGDQGAELLRQRLRAGADLEARDEHGERPLHVATRRRRAEAVAILLDAGAALDARDGHGKSAFAHAARRGFDDVLAVLRSRGADETLNAADRLAVALVNGRLEEARAILAAHPGAARTGNPEEDRLLADVAGRSSTAPLELLLGAGADLRAAGLDGGTALHQTAWFGQPASARLLIDAGAPLDVFDPTHGGSPIHWAAHGSRYSGGAGGRQEVYVELACMLLAAGASLHYPGDPTDGAYLRRLLEDASPSVAAVIQAHLER